MIEHGRPFIWGNIHSPTAAKYCARSNFVTGRLSSPSGPAPGHNTLSGFEITTPMTAPDGWFAEPERRAVRGARRAARLADGRGSTIAVASAGVGVSA